MKHIIVVLGSLTGGGTERVATHMISWWVRSGYSVTVITRLGPEKDFYSLPTGLDRIVLGDAGDSPNRFIGLYRNLERILKLRRAIKQAGYPFVISMLARTNVLTVLACVGLKKHVVISERNDPRRQRQRWPWNWLRRSVYRYADVVTANSRQAVEQMKKYVSASKLLFLPNPVIIPENPAAPDTSAIILNVGRLVAQKSQSLLIEAFAQLTDSFEEWSVDILGDGEERDPLAVRIHALGLAGRVHLRGLVEDTSPYYRSAGIFVLPSSFEGTPNALLEAMAHGVPCIVSDVVGNGLEFIEDGVTACLFSTGDVDDLANKTRALMTNPELRKRLGDAAREKMGDYTFSEVAAVWEAAFEKRSG